MAPILGSAVWLVAAIALALATTILAVKLAQTRRRENALRARIPVPLLSDDAIRVLSILKAAAVLIDEDGDLVSASPSAYAFGLVRADEIAHEAIRDLVARVRAGEEIVEEEYELPRGAFSASAVMLLVRVANIGRGRILVLAEDQTEAHRIEAIRRDFVVNVSHELKTPVGAIQLLAETVNDAADDPEAVRRFTEQMAVEANRLSVLVQEIIELARIQSTGSLSDVKVVYLADVIAEAVARAQTAATAKNITIRTSGEADLMVYGDQALLTTAVRNLIDNAVTYSPASTRVGVGVKEVDGLVEIAVVDQGIGIGEADQKRIFERFYRTDPARSRHTGGTGLGLSIVKHIAHDHGGDITVWSAPKAGSTFTLQLPSAGTFAGAPARLSARIDSGITSFPSLDMDDDIGALSGKEYL
ncbi:MAG: two-component sensor histidine kinase [Cellulomonadaceae bacterium]|nr:two-component sensor histidine kinase [Cellulomonadaceae bacterium]